MFSAHSQIPGQLAFGEPAEPPALIRRALRRGPRTRMLVSRPPQPAAQQPAASPRVLLEWHDMSAGERCVAWAGLRAWVTWLHDRYELATEERLPRCWPQHPGLVEELYALRTWREEIYSSTQPSGQAARYWHAELRTVLHAAATMYAAGCRAGHRTAPSPAAADPARQKQWASASPVTGIPGTEIASGQRNRQAEGGWLSHPAMAAALDAGQARQPGPDLPDVLLSAGGWWIPVAACWLRVSDPGQGARLNARSPRNQRQHEKGS